MTENQNCPWAGFKPGTLDFCEEQLCAWIVAPAETWSNLFYLLVGAFLLRQGLKQRASGAPLLNLRSLLGAIAITIGLFSGLYHASHIWITETFDLGSMSFLSAFLLAHALVRVGWLTVQRFWRTYFFLVAVSWITLAFIDGPPRLWVFSSMIFLYVYLEGFLAIRARRLSLAVRYLPLFQTLAIFIVSYLFWLMDFYRWKCDPTNHFLSGHAGWHILNAFCFLTLATYLEQFGSPWLAKSRLNRYA